MKGPPDPGLRHGHPAAQNADLSAILCAHWFIFFGAPSAPPFAAAETASLLRRISAVSYTHLTLPTKRIV